MRVAVSAAKARLTELARRAEGGDDITPTRRVEVVARIIPVVRAPAQAARFATIDHAVAMSKATPGPSAAQSQNFLYSEDGPPV
jgi:antitoxin (DNA-binding transcriptional repressor) of toxin-antitoxin stability system